VSPCHCPLWTNTSVWCFWNGSHLPALH
jgi:hypothetical protein